MPNFVLPTKPFLVISPKIGKLICANLHLRIPSEAGAVAAAVTEAVDATEAEDDLAFLYLTTVASTSLSVSTLYVTSFSLITNSKMFHIFRN